MPSHCLALSQHCEYLNQRVSDSLRLIASTEHWLATWYNPSGHRRSTVWLASKKCKGVSQWMFTCLTCFTPSYLVSNSIVSIASLTIFSLVTLTTMYVCLTIRCFSEPSYDLTAVTSPTTRQWRFQVTRFHHPHPQRSCQCQPSFKCYNWFNGLQCRGLDLKHNRDLS